MFEKNLKLAYLLDFYGSVLNEQTHNVMTAYYDDDLSLAEIAEGMGISRQGVRHIIKKGEEQLTFLEERLGLAEHYEKLGEAEKMLGQLKGRLSNMTVADDSIIETISSVQDIIANKWI